MSQPHDQLQHIVDQCAERAWRMAYAMLFDAHDADEAVQQAFVVALRKAHEIPHIDPWPWFATVVAFEAMKVRTGKARRGTRLMDEGAMQLIRDEKNMGPSEQVETEELHARVWSELERLPQAERDAVVLTVMSGMSYEVAAASLGIVPSTLAYRVQKGLAALRHRIGCRSDVLRGTLMTLPAAGFVQSGGWAAAKQRWKDHAIETTTPGEVVSSMSAITAGIGGGVLVSKYLIGMIAAFVLVCVVIVSYYPDTEPPQTSSPLEGVRHPAQPRRDPAVRQDQSGAHIPPSEVAQASAQSPADEHASDSKEHHAVLAADPDTGGVAPVAEANPKAPTGVIEVFVYDAEARPLWPISVFLSPATNQSSEAIADTRMRMTDGRGCARFEAVPADATYRALARFHPDASASIRDRLLGPDVVRLDALGETEWVHVGAGQNLYAEIRIPPTSWLRARLVTPNGEACSGATFQINSEVSAGLITSFRQVAYGIADQHGEFLVPLMPGHFSLVVTGQWQPKGDDTVSYDNDTVGESDTVARVVIEDNGTCGMGNILLVPRTRIRGKVLLDGAPLATSLRISVLPIGKGHGLAGLIAPEQVTLAESDAEGRFESRLALDNVHAGKSGVTIGINQGVELQQEQDVTQQILAGKELTLNISTEGYGTLKVEFPEAMQGLSATLYAMREESLENVFSDSMVLKPGKDTDELRIAEGRYAVQVVAGDFISRVEIVAVVAKQVQQLAPLFEKGARLRFVRNPALGTGLPTRAVRLAHRYRKQQLNFPVCLVLGTEAQAQSEFVVFSGTTLSVIAGDLATVWQTPDLHIPGVEGLAPASEDNTTPISIPIITPPPGEGLSFDVDRMTCVSQ